MQERTLNIVMTAVGIALCGTSVGMARHAGFGTDPFTVLVTGLDHRLDLGYGVIFTTLAAILLVGVFRLKRRLIGLATIFTLVGLALVDPLLLIVEGEGVDGFAVVRLDEDEVVAGGVGVVVVAVTPVDGAADLDGHGQDSFPVGWVMLW